MKDVILFSDCTEIAVLERIERILKVKGGYRATKAIGVCYKQYADAVQKDKNANAYLVYIRRMYSEYIATIYSSSGAIEEKKIIAECPVKPIANFIHQITKEPTNERAT